MTLRTKIIILWVAIFLAIFLGSFLYIQNKVNERERDTLNLLATTVEKSAGQYAIFISMLKQRVFDWSSGPSMQGTIHKLLTTKNGSSEHKRLESEFSQFLESKRMFFDETAYSIDLIDRTGTVIASTDNSRIHRSLIELPDYRGFETSFQKVIDSDIHNVFIDDILLIGNTHGETMIHAMVRPFITNDQNKIVPLDSVLLFHFSKINQIESLITAASETFKSESQTSEIYFVNSEGFLLTETRNRSDLHQIKRIKTPAVFECLGNNHKTLGKYTNTDGEKVFGASECIKDTNLVLIAEIQKSEVYSDIGRLYSSAGSITGILSLVSFLLLYKYSGKTLIQIENVRKAIRKVNLGNLRTIAAIKSEDEIGQLATDFNAMTESLLNAQEGLKKAKIDVDIKRAKYEALLENIGEGMIATDEYGNIIAINKIAMKLLALTDPIGKKAIEMWDMFNEAGESVPDEKRPILLATQGIKTVSEDFEYQTKSGRRFPVSITVTPVYLRERIIGSINIFRDITKEKELEKTRRDVLSLASHQLRTPLSGTKWLIETLKKGLIGELNPSQTEYVNELYKINERMIVLVHDMLNVLKTEDGSGFVKSMKDVSVDEVITSVYELLRNSAESKHIQIKISNLFNGSIQTDLGTLRNVLESLVSNAINYSKDGNDISIFIEKQGSEVVFAIKDSGIGIPKSEQQRIFERFYRTSNAKTFDTRGSGLGLYTASLLAKKIGARISFISEENKGSTFLVHVPIEANLPQDAEGRIMD